MNTEQLNKLGWFMTRGNPNRCQHQDGRTLERGNDGAWYLDGKTAMNGRTVGDAAISAECRKALDAAKQAKKKNRSKKAEARA